MPTALYSVGIILLRQYAATSFFIGRRPGHLTKLKTLPQFESEPDF